MKILIVDDEVDFATTLAERLEIRGHEMIIAYTGQDGLAQLESQAIDVVLLDINMPDINGFEVLEQIEKQGKKPTVFMLTGHAYESHKDEAFEKGAKDCLTKPIDIKLLMEKLTSIEN